MQENQLIDPQEVKIERSAILSNLNSSEERKDCLLFKSQGTAFDSKLKMANKEYENVYQETSSLYLIKRVNNITKLCVYDIKNKTEIIKKIWTPEPLCKTTCLAILPNGELFCFGKDNPISGITLTISSDFNIRILPSGTPCCYSSAIYFNRGVYCFGGIDSNDFCLSLSERFDLDKNRWIKLTSMPWHDYMCQSTAFNGNILISGFDNMYIWIYSVDTDSFSTIDYYFSHQRRKILANSIERLYLIGCEWNTSTWIYESEIGDEYSWKKVGKSAIRFSSQVYYCIYKESVYISTFYSSTSGCIVSFKNGYFKFNLNEKKIVQLNNF